MIPATVVVPVVALAAAGFFGLSRPWHLPEAVWPWIVQIGFGRAGWSPSDKLRLTTWTWVLQPAPDGADVPMVRKCLLGIEARAEGPRTSQEPVAAGGTERTPMQDLWHSWRRRGRKTMAG